MSAKSPKKKSTLLCGSGDTSPRKRQRAQILEIESDLEDASQPVASPEGTNGRRLASAALFTDDADHGSEWKRVEVSMTQRMDALERQLSTLSESISTAAVPETQEQAESEGDQRMPINQITRMAIESKTAFKKRRQALLAHLNQLIDSSNAIAARVPQV